MLAPLTRIRDATSKATSGHLSHRIHLKGRTDEFRELADAFDVMLERVEAQVAEGQRFAANASHELRTPLSITRTVLEVARADPDRDATAAFNQLEAVNDRAIALTEALLLFSRAERRVFLSEAVDLSRRRGGHRDAPPPGRAPGHLHLDRRLYHPCVRVPDAHRTDRNEPRPHCHCPQCSGRHSPRYNHTNLLKQRPRPSDIVR
nr:HAMP domain-containing sensor histidine kinase [Plantibacter sp. VKM Ac-2880]